MNQITVLQQVQPVAVHDSPTDRDTPFHDVHRRWPPWTQQETAFIREWYGKKNYKEIALVLGRTHEAVRHKVVLMGLSRCMVHPEFDQRMMERWRREYE